MNKEHMADLVTALRRGSSMSLDTLGIPVDVGAAHQHYAERVGKHPLFLTEDESMQGILEYIQSDSALTTALQAYTAEQQRS